MSLIYDRKTKQEYEYVQYGEKYINFVYHNWFGRIILKIIILPFFSKFYGFFNNTKRSTKKIDKFIESNNIDMNLYEKKEYTSFNDFFTRKKLDIFFDENPNSFLSPADSKLLVYKITEDLHLNIKNKTYTLEQLLHDDSNVLDDYKNGNCFVFRLSVDDYHRYHYIDDGRLEKQVSIKGKLHTVCPISEDYPIYAENSRVCNYLTLNNFGDVIYIEVGAMLVGKIINHDVDTFVRGREKGYFEYGGSTIVLITKDNIEVDPDIIENSNKGIETKVAVGEKIGMKK